MKRYAAQGVGEAIVNVVGSIAKINMERYNDDNFLANYGNVPITLSSTKEILRTIEEIRGGIKDVQGRDGLYLKGMVDAFELYTHILDGETISYQKACKTLQQVDIDYIPQWRYDELSDRIGAALEEFGYKGDTGQKVTAWLNDTKIDPEEVTKTADLFLEKAKQQTLKNVIMLPENDGIDSVSSIRNVFWSGYSRYTGNFRGNLTFNIDRPWSMPTFANILCHEGYPGHQAFYCHWDDLYLRGELPLEAAFYSTAGNPANPMFEGTPECGLHFLGWDDFNEYTPEITDEQKKIFAIGRDILDLQRMLQTQGCIMYHVYGEKEETVIKYMQSTNVFTEVEARNSFNFFSHPVQRYYYPAYYYGRWMILEGYNAIEKQQRPEFFHFLYDLPHTNETFIQGIKEMTGKDFDPLRDR